MLNHFKYSSLVEINVPSTVTTITEGAFHHCSSLKNVSIGDGRLIREGKRTETKFELLL
ncbi:MAG: leucine-rich repeat domain-containing protein [Holosporales bacterium]|nr:leucine-rich repeat domain-containing protein [Holosporales bacterium]